LVYLSTNKQQTHRDEYSWFSKILDADCKQASARLYDVIMTFENLHVEEQHQLKILLQKYHHLFDSSLLMNLNCKPIHTCAYTVSRSLEEEKWQQGKEIVRLVEIGFLEKDYSSDWASPVSKIITPKKRLFKRLGT
jgi:hypothetical protein